MNKEKYVKLNDELENLGVSRIDRIKESDKFNKICDYVLTCLHEKPIISKKGKGGYTYIHWLVACHMLIQESPNVLYKTLDIYINNGENGTKRFEIMKEFHESIESKIYIKTWLYIIKDRSNGHIKIGISNNVDNRLKQHQMSNPNKIELYTKVKCYNAIVIEKEILNKFKSFIIHGEWLDGNKVSVSDIIKYIRTQSDLFKVIFIDNIKDPEKRYLYSK